MVATVCSKNRQRVRNPRWAWLGQPSPHTLQCLSTGLCQPTVDNHTRCHFPQVRAGRTTPNTTMANTASSAPNPNAICGDQAHKAPATSEAGTYNNPVRKL